MKVRLFQTAIVSIAALLAMSCAPATENTVSGSHEAQEPLSLPSTGGVSDPAKAPEQELASLRKEQEGAKAAFEESKSDTDKKKFIDTNLKLAVATMKSTALNAREKYPPALKLYREVLKVDPDNAEAKEWIKKIEDIYTQMNRPIPQ